MRKVKEVIQQDNITRMRMIYEGKVLIDIPLMFGIMRLRQQLQAAPLVAATSAIAALIIRCTIQRDEREDFELAA